MQLRYNTNNLREKIIAVLLILILHILLLFLIFKYFKLNLGKPKEDSNTWLSVSDTVSDPADLVDNQDLQDSQDSKDLSQASSKEDKATDQTQEDYQNQIELLTNVEISDPNKPKQEEMPKLDIETTEKTETEIAAPDIDNLISTKPEEKEEEIQDKPKEQPKKIVTKKKIIRPVRKSTRQNLTSKTVSQVPSINQAESSSLNKKTRISPQEFFNSFSRSYRTDQVNKAQAAARQSTAKCPQYVQDRINEFSLMDFRQKVDKAFVDAIKRVPGVYLNIDQTFIKDISIKLNMQKDGTLKIDYFESSGVEEIDNYLKSVLLDVVLCPIPKRLNIDFLELKRTIKVDVNKDARFYRLVPYTGFFSNFIL